MAYDSPRQVRRREKLRALVGTDLGALAALGREVGTPRSHLSAILLGTRGIGDTLAAKLERHFEKPAGWFDLEDGASWPFSAELKSKVLALTDEELRDAENVLRAHLRMATIPIPNTVEQSQQRHTSGVSVTPEPGYRSSTERPGTWREVLQEAAPPGTDDDAAQDQRGRRSQHGGGH